MAKKTTKKTAAKTGGKTKASSGTSKKTAKKAAAKKSTKKVAKKPAAKKTASKVSKKATKAKSGASKKAEPTKKSAPKKKTTKKAAAAKAAPVDSAGNGKANEAAAPKTVPSTARRVVRPAPAPLEEQVFDDWTPLSDAKLRKIKSGLRRKELNEFKMLLLEKRAEIVGDVLNMEEARSAGNGGDLSNMPLHMADIGSDNYEQEFTIGLVESERKLLVEIDQALLRIQKKIYGVCLINGTPIPKARLEIKPWAKYSIEIIREREKRGLHSF